MAIYTSLTGLNGAQTELSTISNNIANVGSNGFKRSRVEFGDIIGAGTPLQDSKRVTGLGTTVLGVKQQFTQGAIQSSLNTLDMAVSGQGFFVVKSRLGGEVSYTRNGAFNVDSDRYVVDSSGQRLQVLPVNASGVVTASGLDATRPLRIPTTSGAPKATTALNVGINLPSTGEVIPDNPRYDALNPYAFDKNNPQTYNGSTSATVYDSLGNPQAATVYYVRTSEATGGSTTSTWDAHVFVGDQELSTVAASVPATPVTLTFDSFGTLTAPTGPASFAPVTLPSGGEPLALSLDHGVTTTQVADPLTVYSSTQDGFPAGRLDGVSIDSGGLVIASFSNGQSQSLGRVVLANFDNPNGLKQVGNARFTPTGAAGEMQLGEAGTAGLGTVMSGSLERSNVDLTEELVSLITAQRNFQANAKAIETDSTMTQAIINIRG